MAGDPDSKKKTVAEEIPNVLPLLPVRDLVVFPYMIAPLRVSRPISLDAVNAALASEERLCFIVAQRESSDEDPKPGALYRTGTVGVIMRMRKLSDGGLKILVQGLCRARIQRFVSDSPCYRVRMERTEDRVLKGSPSVELMLTLPERSVRPVIRLGEPPSFRSDEVRLWMLAGTLSRSMPVPGRGVVPMPALIVIGLWIVLQFVNGIGAIAQTSETGGVAYMAHVGGFLAGLVLTFLFGGRRTEVTA